MSAICFDGKEIGLDGLHASARRQVRASAIARAPAAAMKRAFAIADDPGAKLRHEFLFARVAVPGTRRNVVTRHEAARTRLVPFGISRRVRATPKRPERAFDGSARAAPLDVDVIVVDPAGNAVVPTRAEPAPAAAAPPAPTESTAPQTSTPVPPKAPSFQAAPEPAPAPPPPKPTKPAHSSLPADAAAHFTARDAERARQNDDDLKRRQEAARADPVRYPGGQIPMNELRPDVNNAADQGHMEIVAFTRIPGGKGIKRVG